MRRRAPHGLLIASAPLALAACDPVAWNARDTGFASGGGSGAYGTTRVDRPTFAQAYSTWALPSSNPWAPFEKYTLLTYLTELDPSTPLPDPNDLPEVHRAVSAGQRVAARGLPADTIWVVDLHGAASVAFGATVARYAAEDVAPVMTFNNWPAEYEMVPAENTLAALLTFQPRLPASNSVSSRPFFMLDAWRLAHRDEAPADEITDNRYVLNAADLPDAATLRAQGIKRVVYLVEDGVRQPHEEDDLNAIFAAWNESGINISMMDLADLERLDMLVDWDRDLYAHQHWVSMRATILDDPRFWARTPGGFGGVHAAPWVTGSRVGGGGGGSYSGGGSYGGGHGFGG